MERGTPAAPRPLHASSPGLATLSRGRNPMVRAYRLSSTFRAAVLLGGLLALGCARVQNTPVTTNQDGGPMDVRRLSDAILLTCGNRHLDPTEQCDDGN